MRLDCPVKATKKMHLLCVLSVLQFAFGSVSAEINFDGSLGQGGSLAGPNYNIDANRGKLVGNNLFHSFEAFNLNFGEAATFNSVGASGTIDNIMARVTGGLPSHINGFLSSTVPGANLFFLNPAGVLFGPNAFLNIQGAFHVSTADYIQLDDDVRFDANLHFDDQLLSVGQPEAFGFLAQNQPQKIQIDNSILVNNQTFSITAGDIIVSEKSSLASLSGLLRLISISSGGEVKINHSSDMSAFEQMGNIILGTKSSSSNLINKGLITGNTIVIRGGELTLENSISISNTNVLDNITTNPTVDIQLSGALIIQGDQAAIEVSGDGHKLNINVNKLELSMGAEISNVNRNKKFHKNNINISAKEISISGVSNSISNSNQSRILVSGFSDITINAAIVRTTDGGVIESQGGNISIDSKNIVLNGVNSKQRAGVFASAEQEGDSGDIILNTDHLNILNGARIATSNTSAFIGNSGSMEINAKQILVEGVGGGFESSIQAETQGKAKDSGKSGNLNIQTDKLTVRNQANISTRTLGPGNAGTILIDANVIKVQNQGRISSRSESLQTNAGKAGTISINANNFLILSEKSEITVATEQAAAGNIDISADLLALKDQSSITTSVAGGAGDGGNINISPTLLIIKDASKIIANAQQGNAGNIDIQIQDGGTLFESLDSVIEASSQFGINGNVEINAPDVDITSGFKPLPGGFLDVATVLKKPCAQRFQGNTIQFVNRKYQVLPDSPYALRTVSYDQSDETRLTPSLFSFEEPLLISEKQSRLSDCLR